MKLFKKVLAVVLVGAMAVSMLTACGSSKSSKVKDALKDFDIKMDSAMVQDTEKMMGGLQEATAKVTSGAINLTDGTGVDAVVTELNKMTDYSFTTGSDKKYDLYIWTNGADGHQVSSNKTEKYPLPDEGSGRACEQGGPEAPPAEGLRPEGRVQRQQRGCGYSEKPAEGCWC